MIIETIEWHSFLPRFLNPDSVVLDLGANLGTFSHEIIKRFGCHCYAVEASPEVYARIPAGNLLSIYNLAICGKSGPVKFHINENLEASSIFRQESADFFEAIEVPGKNIEEFTEELGISSIDLLKLDIEGAEIEVIDSCSDEFLKKILQITIEFHDFCGITSPVEIRRIVKRLEKHGFFHVRMSGNGYLDTFFINRNRCDISLIECLLMRHVVRNWIGLKRVVKRVMSSKRMQAQRDGKHVKL